MAMYESVTEINTTAGLGELFSYADRVASGIPSGMTLLALFVIILFGIYNSSKSFKQGFIVSSLITFVIATLFRIVGFCTLFNYFLILGVLMVAIIWALFPTNE